MSNHTLKIGIIGMGRMGSCLAQGLLDSGFDKSKIFFSTKHKETATKSEKELNIKAISNKDLVKEADVIILAVKPQNVDDVLAEISSLGSEKKTLISIAASWTTDQIEKKIWKNARVVRAMPNTPAVVKAGITAFCLGKGADDKDSANTRTVFAPLGKLVQVDEKHMDAVTGLSGCGPAYVYVILESLTDAGIKVGLPRDLASELASQTVLGAAKMLQETGKHPASLKDEVTTPAGCTIDGLMELEEGKLRVTLIKAVVQATRRAKELGNG